MSKTFWPGRKSTAVGGPLPHARERGFFEPPSTHRGRVRAPRGRDLPRRRLRQLRATVRLARRGFHVRAVDFSESALRWRAQPKATGIEERIKLQREDLPRLSFPDESFDYILCWGVLMHIPEVGRAVRELSRVLKPGGRLVISEGNTDSWKAVVAAPRRKVRGAREAEVKGRPRASSTGRSAGTARSSRGRRTSAGSSKASRPGVRSEARRGTVLGGLHDVLSPALKRLVHGFNNFWFRRVDARARPTANPLLRKRSERARRHDDGARHKLSRADGGDDRHGAGQEPARLLRGARSLASAEPLGLPRVETTVVTFVRGANASAAPNASSLRRAPRASRSR